MSPHAPPPRGSPSPRRWLLWGTLLLLVGALLVALVFLAGQYERARDQEALERDATALVGDIRGGLLRNVQTLQSLHSVATSVDAWEAPAAELLAQHRELVRLEWRDNQLGRLAHRDSTYLPDLYDKNDRERALHDVRQACDNASRLSGPSYSPSYFWPQSNGLGKELMEMCLPVQRAGEPDGFLVATYALTGLLAEMTQKDQLRGRGLAFTEVDGTRLALHSTVQSARRVQVANALLDLPGFTVMLRLESPRRVGGLFPNVLTAVVGAMSLALLAVLALLGRDIRRRQRAETEAADALAFRKAMENSLVTGLRARDMQGRVTYVNPAFCQMVGYRADELIGTGPPAPWWPPELIDEYQQRQAVRLAGQVLPREGFESVFQRKDGTRFPVLIIEAPLIDAQGVQTGYMSAIVDMSEQRRVEELNRTSQERLQASARLATVGEMASLLSHEINQPLAAIASYATGTLNLLDDAERPAPPELLREAMVRVSEQAERAGRVTRSVADFVRRREQVREAVAPTQLIEAILPLLSMQARKLDIRLETQVAPGCPDVLCDRTMVEQVLLNLARNGMQAMPAGDPPAASGLRTVRLEVIPRPASLVEGGTARKSWVEFIVTDHGVGLSEEAREKLFMPFFTTKAEGMGLGLSLCRTVIEQHGGALSFEPVQPRGTVFRFTLPSS
ncbi:MAG: PAS domain S-box protein [Hydrogenophaga sp.]|nr:PAS domain S-box protein [Hydrogenophaga sp.]